MTRINFQKWKRATMPEDFNGLQDYIEDSSRSIIKNFIGWGLIDGGDIGVSGSSLIIDPFFGADKSGREIFAVSHTTVDISTYLNTNKYLSVVAQYEKKESGLEQDIDNVDHHYNELDSYRIVIKESIFSFPDITDDEVLLRDIKCNSGGSVDVIPGRSVKLNKLKDTITLDEAIVRDDNILVQAKEHANNIGSGALSVTALNSISFDNLVLNGDFNKDIKYWILENDAGYTIKDFNNADIKGNYLYLTRNSVINNICCSQVVAENPPYGAKFSVHAKIKMENGQNGGCRIGLQCLDIDNNVILFEESGVVIVPELTNVYINITIPDNAVKIKLLLEIDVNLNTAYFSEVSCNYGNVAQDFSTSVIEEIKERAEEDNKRLSKKTHVEEIDDTNIEDGHFAIFDKTNKKLKTSGIIISDDETLSNKSTSKIVTERAIDAFVRAIVAQLVNSSPATLDTLNELATALNNDPDFATTMTNQLATKVDKTIQVISGNGISGGGALSTNRTLSVVNDGDSIEVSASGVKVNTVNSLSDTSVSKPLSAAQGKALNDSKANSNDSRFIDSRKCNNTFDNAATSRSNLGLGNSATLNTGTSSGTVAKGDDSRFIDSRKCNNTFDNAATARSGLGIITGKVSYDVSGTSGSFSKEIEFPTGVSKASHIITVSVYNKCGDSSTITKIKYNQSSFSVYFDFVYGGCPEVHILYCCIPL